MNWYKKSYKESDPNNPFDKIENELMNQLRNYQNLSNDYNIRKMSDRYFSFDITDKNGNIYAVDMRDDKGLLNLYIKRSGDNRVIKTGNYNFRMTSPADLIREILEQINENILL